jgi:hypothetical protein
VAAPVVAGKDVWTSGTTSATSHTISFGAGVGTVASGDVLLIVVTYGVTANTVGLTGYTEVLSRERTAGATEGMSSWKLTASGGETSAALSFTVASKATAHVYRITGGDVTSVVAAGADAANANPDPPALTITSGDWLFIAAAGVGNPSGTWSVDPTGYANPIGTTTTGGSATTNTTSRTTDKSVTGSGTSEDPSAYTSSLSVSWVAMTFGIEAATATNATATPAIVAAISTAPTPTLASDQTTTPSAVAAVTSALTATIQGTAQPTPSAVAAISTIPTPTVLTGGNVTVSPTVVAAVSALPAPTLLGAAQPTPTALAAVSAVLAPTIKAAAFIQPSVVTGMASVPTPTILVGGNATVTPAAVAAISAVLAPSLHSDRTVTPAALSILITIPAPTVLGTAKMVPATLAALVAIPTPPYIGGGTQGLPVDDPQATLSGTPGKAVLVNQEGMAVLQEV